MELAVSMQAKRKETMSYSQYGEKQVNSLCKLNYCQMSDSSELDISQQDYGNVTEFIIHVQQIQNCLEILITCTHKRDHTFITY